MVFLANGKRSNKHSLFALHTQLRSVTCSVFTILARRTVVIFWHFLGLPKKGKKGSPDHLIPAYFSTSEDKREASEGAPDTRYKGRQAGYGDTYSSIHVLDSVFSHLRSECILLNAILLSISGDKQPTYHKSSYFMQ